MTVSSYKDITRTEPERSLMAPLRKQAGRNNRGTITVRHRGGGHKRRYRIIDFRHDGAQLWCHGCCDLPACAGGPSTNALALCV